MSDLKKAVHDRCMQWVDARINLGRKELKELKQAMDMETKSSMGDKYETTRELIQQEKDKAAGQVHQAGIMYHELSRLDPAQTSDHVERGSLVETNHGIFYFAVSLGEIKLDQEKRPVFIISLASPLGQALQGAKKGQEIRFQDRTFKIFSIH